mmetsp:Transcript_3960/g.6241  ORF Transcript_3960/g.6241 Transcript_3960/m.6241 type:complete len:389 (-) Transcript_3960:348-1514(-)|eukprot:CAMPEP_0201606050 /NCGR_PEP_ID=MMETSP0492-20130828/5643_1 /ASSEMBLY_ACC=CAM_ASM_000837 /TAXON_ID=420259 /ORGANISM="Thalassiosira gravida, Strain GMp14c1" /LENGTH=388 /DNA_ID=CAMNT_0048070389 /DNA_START=7 /DNA_END=1173 /DNA_ORIENTATION=-
MSTPEDISITATDATVAGSSLAVTEAEEDAASFAQSAGGDEDNADEDKFVLTKESSVKGIKIANFEEDDDDDDDDEKESDEEYAAPMHLHALRTPARLKGAPRSRSSSRSRPGSRRNSISPPRKVVGGGELIVGGFNLSPSPSVESSLDGNLATGTPSSPHSSRSSLCGDSFVDPDILLDKLGMKDLDPNVTQAELQELLKRHISSSGLPTLNERMSEETLDDVHAFQDLKFVKKSGSKEESDVDSTPEKASADMRELLRKGNLSSSAIAGNMSYLLNTLDEGEEDGDDEDIVWKIPEEVVTEEKKSHRQSNISMMAVTSETSFDDEDEEGAAVDVPTSVMEELNLCQDRRRLKNRDSTMAAAPSNVDYLEDDEQDGLEADRAEDVPR